MCHDPDGLRTEFSLPGQNSTLSTVCDPSAPEQVAEVRTS